MAFDADQVEDGTGRSTALVYEQPEDAALWLAARGKTLLQDAAAEAQNVALLRATEAAEEAVRPHLEGRSRPRVEDQGLLFPRLGAYTSARQLLEEDEIPVDPGPLGRYLRGIRLLAERVAAGTFMAQAGGPFGLKEERDRDGALVYRDGIDLSSLQANHPEEWRLISSAVPPL